MCWTPDCVGKRESLCIIQILSNKDCSYCTLPQTDATSWQTVSCFKLKILKKPVSRLQSGKEADRLFEIILCIYRKRSGGPSVRLLGCSRYREECWLFVDTTPSLTSRAALSCTGASSPVGAYGIGWRETHRKSLWRWHLHWCCSCIHLKRWVHQNHQERKLQPL